MLLDQHPELWAFYDTDLTGDDKLLDLRSQLALVKTLAYLTGAATRLRRRR